MASSLLFLLFLAGTLQRVLSLNYIILSDSHPSELTHISQEFHDVDPGQCCVPLDLYALSTGQHWPFKAKVADFYQSHAHYRQYNVFQNVRFCAGPPAELVEDAPESWSSRGSYERITGATLGSPTARTLKFPNALSVGYGDYRLDQRGPNLVRYVKTNGEGPLSIMGMVGDSLSTWPPRLWQ